MEEMIMEGSLLNEMMKLTMTTTEKQKPLESHWEFCYSTLLRDGARHALGKDSKIPSILFETGFHSKYIHALKEYLGIGEVLDVYCVAYCVIKALDAVEDDPTIPSELKVSILENFHRHIYDRDLQISCGTKLEKVLMDQYHHISTALLELQKGYQNLIEYVIKVMGAGMKKFILNEVVTLDDYNEYLYKVSGICFVEMSKVLHASNLEELTSDHLSNSMGVFVQKVHLIIDFFDDMKEIPKGRIYWPREIWSKYVDKLEDLTYKENSEKSLCCLNDMVTDALSHAVDCLEYLSILRHSVTFQTYAIMVIANFGSLSLCYNNIEVFSGRVKTSPGQYVKAFLGTKAMSDVYEAFNDIFSTLRTKIDSNDPNATKTLICVEQIQKVCEDSGLLNQRSSPSTQSARNPEVSFEEEVKELPAGLIRERIPKHVAIIIDGNRRWAKEKGLTTMEGHTAGLKRVMELVPLCYNYGIKVEVAFLMKLVEKSLEENSENFTRDGVRLSVIGESMNLPESLQRWITKATETTKNNSKLHVIMAINYGGRQDIIQACQKISHKVKDGVIKPEDIDETLLNQELGTNCTEFPYPDLLIRTSGEQRISNFLMWQLAYTELHFELSHWPDFGEKEFVKALLSFQARNRRFGGETA
ncbi:hypothetical protein MKX03_017546 [Papaver bracteatum]|nr:hypothetical protein MKX03_017546 [Papaver bracteatum]